MLCKTLNLGILAHVDAGKTTLTERLLYAAGVIDEIGSVDAGSTQTDTLALERERGITIKSAVVSFVIDDVTVNLIDTPGHPDFIAEVERVLSVLDGAVLVISAVEGVQPQTRLLMRALMRLRIPTLLFVNKIDRAGAGYERVLEAISERLTPAIVAMGAVDDLGTRAARFTPWGAGDAALRTRLTEVLAERDDSILAAYVDDNGVAYRRLREELAAQTGRSLVHPVFFGSAITGAGADSLMAGIAELLPAATGDADGPVSGTVFKVERGPAGNKIAYVRMLSGTVRVRDRLQFGREAAEKVTAISVFDRGDAVRRGSVVAGEIGKLWGLGGIQIGDAVGTWQTASEEHHFAPPTLETVVVPQDPEAKGALRVALAQLAEQDPLIDVRQDDVHQELSVSLYGEVQKEVIQATLARDFGLDVTFRETTTICIERPLGTGEAVEILRAESNPFLATIGLRVDPAPPGAGFEFRLRGRRSHGAALRLQDGRKLHRAHGRVRPGDAAGGALRLAGHGLHRDDDPVHVQHPRRPSIETGKPQHGRRLPQADADRRHARARGCGNGRLRADRASQPRDPDGHDRSGDARAGAARCRARDTVARGEAHDDRAAPARGASP